MGPNYHPELPRQLNEIRRQLLQHDVDIKRLWQLLQPKGEGWPIGGTGTPSPVVGPWSDYEETGGGGGTDCDPQNAVFIVTLFGPPTGGTWRTSWKIGGSTELLAAVAHSATAATYQTNIITHSNVGSGDVLVTGGPGNTTNYRVEFTGALAHTFIETPLIQFSSLTGTGIGGIAYPVQIGRS